MPSHRNCCVVGCTNSYYTIILWERQMCDIHNDYHGGGKCTCAPPFKWVKFPQDSSTRATWMRLINRQNFSLKDDTRICSRHFLDGMPSSLNPYPTEDMGYNILSKPVGRTSRGQNRKGSAGEPSTSNRPCRRKYSKKLSELHPCTTLTDLNLNKSPPLIDCVETEKLRNISTNSAHMMESEIGTNVCATVDFNQNESMTLDHSYSFGQTETDASCEGCDFRQSEIERLKKELKKAKSDKNLWMSKFMDKQNKPFGFSCITSDTRCRALTGIPTKRVFNAIFNVLSPRISRIKHWRGSRTVCNVVRKYSKRSPRKHGASKILSEKDQMLVTLMKIRLNLTNVVLGLLFGVADTTISRIWTTWVKFLSHELVSLNPEKEYVRSSLPKTFQTRKYIETRHIIDCSEIFIETPKNFETRTLTWSEYKHHHTIKFLVSINPNGYICYVSPCWGGRTSDQHITMNSNFEDILEPYDVIMADKGFSSLGSWFAQKRCTLIVPPGKCGEVQMTKADVEKTKDIANRRIHVEQAIRRLKTFRMLRDEMCISMVPHANNVLKICQFLSNLLGQIAKM